MRACACVCLSVCLSLLKLRISIINIEDCIASNITQSTAQSFGNNLITDINIILQSNVQSNNNYFN